MKGMTIRTQSEEKTDALLLEKKVVYLQIFESMRLRGLRVAN